MAGSAYGFFNAANTEDAIDPADERITVPKHQYDDMMERILEGQRAMDSFRLEKASDSVVTNAVKGHAEEMKASETSRTLLVTAGIAGTILTGGVGGLALGAVLGYGSAQVINIPANMRASRFNAAADEARYERDEIRIRMQTPLSYNNIIPYTGNAADQPNDPTAGTSFQSGGPGSGIAA